ncbi:MAG: hypothetical protein QM639_20370, partial [Rhodocyclaceae bacterium]
MNTTIKTRLIALLGLACAGLLLTSGYNLWQLARLADQAAQGNQTLLGAQALSADLGRAATSFKTQVQEWKNVLVRGNERAAYDHHLEGFTKEEGLTREALQAVATDLKKLGVDDAPALKALAEHGKLGAQYRQALQRFDAADAETGKKVDSAVRGMDRPLADALEELGAAVGKTTRERSDTQVANGA